MREAPAGTQPVPTRHEHAKMESGHRDPWQQSTARETILDEGAAEQRQEGGGARRGVSGDKGKLGRAQHRHTSAARGDFRMVERACVTRNEAADREGTLHRCQASWLLIGGTVSEGNIIGAGSPARALGGPDTGRMWSAQDPKKVAQKPHSGPECPYWLQTKPNDFRDISRATQGRP